MIYLIGPTESVLLKEVIGSRIWLNIEKGEEVCYLTTDHYHAEKRHFNDSEIKNAITTQNMS